MNRVLSLARVCSVALFVAILGAGCSSKTAVNTVPVSGKVTVENEPLTGGQVAFVPFDEGMSGEISAGKIDPSGGYKIYTAGKEGAPPGRYKVTVSPTMLPSEDGKMPMMPFDTKFTDSSKTTLIIEVKANPDPGAYDLKLTRPKAK